MSITKVLLTILLLGFTACNSSDYSAIQPAAVTPASSSSQSPITETVSPASSTESSAPHASPTHFLYVANKGDDTISEFGIDPVDATLIPIVGHEFIATDSQPIVLLSYPTQNILLCLNHNASTVTQYSINPTTGALTYVSKIGVDAITPYALGINSKYGNDFYVVTDPKYGQTVANRIIMNSITGAMTYYSSYITALVSPALYLVIATSSISVGYSSNFSSIGTAVYTASIIQNSVNMYVGQYTGNNTFSYFTTGNNPVALAVK